MDDRRAELDDLIAHDRLLEAAELLKIDARKRSRLQDMFGRIKELVDGAYGHLFAGSEWHDAMVRAEPRVIVTTNYDKIVERATLAGYVVHEYISETVAADVRRNYPLLLKIHGTVDRVEGLVLSRRDNTDVRHKGAHAMETLHALLLTRPALLLGYRLRDPDLQLILENIFRGQNHTPPHYMLAPDDMPDYERDVLTYSYGVNVISYPPGDHGEALKRFQELADLVAATGTTVPLSQMSTTSGEPQWTPTSGVALDWRWPCRLPGSIQIECLIPKLLVRYRWTWLAANSPPAQRNYASKY